MRRRGQPVLAAVAHELAKAVRAAGERGKPVPGRGAAPFGPGCAAPVVVTGSGFRFLETEQLVALDNVVPLCAVAPLVADGTLWARVQTAPHEKDAAACGACLGIPRKGSVAEGCRPLAAPNRLRATLRGRICRRGYWQRCGGWSPRSAMRMWKGGGDYILSMIRVVFVQP